MQDKLESLQMLLNAHRSSLQNLLVQRSAYAGRDVPRELEQKIAQERESILDIQREIESIQQSSVLSLNQNDTVPNVNPIEESASELLARIPNPNDLLPVLVPHNLVLDLQEYRKIQETAFTIAGVMFGGVSGILINWLTAGLSRESMNAAAIVALIALSIGTLLSIAAGLWWGYRRAKSVEEEIAKYIESMQLIRISYTGGPPPKQG